MYLKVFFSPSFVPFLFFFSLLFFLSKLSFLTKEKEDHKSRKRIQSYCQFQLNTGQQ